MKKSLILSLLLFLSSCGNIRVTSYAPLDLYDKTVVVSPVRGGLSADLNNVLRQEGFKVYIKNVNVDIGHSKLTSRYEMIYDLRAFDVCLIGGTAFNFSITMVDLIDNTEVFNLSGRECQDKIVDAFRELFK